jgi:hypothetical protein
MDQGELGQFRLALPPHLAESDKKLLLQQLQGFPGESGFFGVTDDDEPVQGDAWRGFQILNPDSGKHEAVTGIVISNSCDLAAANDPDPDQNIVFAPMVDLDRYTKLLLDSGQSKEEVGSKVDQIRKQQIHRIFFIPENGSFGGESLIMLDDLYTQPLEDLDNHPMEKLFSLSNYGWYVFLMKLSVHFTRMTDGVPRRPVNGDLALARQQS